MTNSDDLEWWVVVSTCFCQLQTLSVIGDSDVLVGTGMPRVLFFFGYMCVVVLGF
jgi:hypothetical protein